jgi:hypothetical protein
MFRRRLHRLSGRVIVVRGGTRALSPGEGGSFSLAMPLSPHAQFRDSHKESRCHKMHRGTIGEQPKSQIRHRHSQFVISICNQQCID